MIKKLTCSFENSFGPESNRPHLIWEKKSTQFLKETHVTGKEQAA